MDWSKRCKCGNKAIVVASEEVTVEPAPRYASAKVKVTEALCYECYDEDNMELICFL